jgi:Zn-dependent protease
MDWLVQKLLFLPGIIIGLTVHEFAHAKVASVMGDNTAKNLGRVSLNPLRHIDIIGFICLIVVGFGWGKPVPVNPYNLSGKNRKFKQVAISAAGVVMNLILAVLLAVVMTSITVHRPAMFSGNGVYLYHILYYGMYINIVLMIFNLIPIPPLDGFNIIAELTSFDETPLYHKLLQYGSIILIILLVTNIIDLVLTPGINGVLRLINSVLGVLF